MVNTFLVVAHSSRQSGEPGRGVRALRHQGVVNVRWLAYLSLLRMLGQWAITLTHTVDD